MSATSAGRRVGLTLKIFAATALVVVLVLAAALVLTSVGARRAANEAVDSRLANTSEVARAFIDAEKAKLASGAAAAAQAPTFIAAVVSGDPSTVLDQAQQYREILGADYTLITDNQAVLKARTDRPGVAGDTLGGPIIGRALEGTQVAGYVNQADERLYLVVATPLKDLASGVVQAMLLAAHQVTDSLAEEVKRATGSDIVFYLIGEDDQHRTHVPHVVASTVPRTAELDGAIARHFTPEAMANDTAMGRTEARIGSEQLVGFNRFLANPPPEGVAERPEPLAGYLSLRSLDAELTGYRKLQRTLLLAALLGLLLALAASGIVARRISRPVLALVGATRRVAEGDYSGEVVVTSKDEIGELAASFKHMMEELRAKQQLVEFLSSRSGEVTQPIYTAGGDVASATLVRSVASRTGMLEPGAMFASRYEVKGVLGMGGMGVVYRAWDTELGEPVAIKTLKSDTMGDDPTALQRFKDEIRLARKITHRNVVRTHDIGEVDGLYFITMEFVEGQSLKHLIQSRGSLPINVALTVGKQLCRALEVAHEQGVIHRDIKPQNLILEPSGTLKVMDFGIARLATRTEGVTQAGMAIGTPEYMAPEQLLGAEVDFRADLYAAGAVLFESLTGRPPFVADSPITLVAKQLEETPPSPRSLNAEVPESLASLVLKTLSKDPGKRPQSAAELHDALDAISP
ncbi:MAG: protein kinase [Gemmatimonadetes bacterium]|nr:protein kinase [Gemmatimonadota bacterium]